MDIAGGLSAVLFICPLVSFFLLADGLATEKLTTHVVVHLRFPPLQWGTIGWPQVVFVMPWRFPGSFGFGTPLQKHSFGGGLKNKMDDQNKLVS